MESLAQHCEEGTLRGQDAQCVGPFNESLSSNPKLSFEAPWVSNLSSEVSV